MGRVAVALLTLIAVPAPAAWASGYSPARTLPEADEYAVGAQVAVDSRDRATVVWDSTTAEGRVVRAVRLAADGEPEPARTLAPMPGSVAWAHTPRLLVDSADRVTVVWQAVEGGDQLIQAVRLAADGTPGPVRTLSAAGADGLDPSLAVDQDGRTTVVWSLREGIASRVQAVQLASSGEPGPVRTLSPSGGDATRPHVAVGSGGEVAVAWSYGDGASQRVQATVLDSDGAATDVTTLSPANERSGLPRLVVDSRGNVTVSWWRSGGPYEVRAARIEADGSPGPATTLSPAGQSVLNPDVVIDRSDRVTVTWESFAESIHAIQLDSEGAAGEAQMLSAPDQRAGSPSLAADAAGGVVVTWAHPIVVFIPPWDSCRDHAFHPSGDAAWSVRIDADGELGPIAQVSEAGQQSLAPDVAVGELGRPTVVWHAFDGSYFCPAPSATVRAARGASIAAGDPPVGSTPPPAPTPAQTLPLALPNAGPSAAVDDRLRGTLHVRRRATDDSRRLLLVVSCRGPRTAVCQGAIQLRGRARPCRPRRSSCKRIGIRRETGLLLGARRYRLVAGRRRVLAVRLSKTGRRAMRRRRDALRLSVAGPGVKATQLRPHLVATGVARR